MASHSDNHADDDDYVHGTMDTSAHANTYKSFLVASQWGSILIAAMVACMAMIWGAGVEWLPAVLGCGAGAILAGLFMKMGGAFTVTSVVLTLIAMIAGGISTLLGMFS